MTDATITLGDVLTIIKRQLNHKGEIDRVVLSCDQAEALHDKTIRLILSRDDLQAEVERLQQTVQYGPTPDGKGVTGPTGPMCPITGYET